jgi:hypothetical protein
MLAKEREHRGVEALGLVEVRDVAAPSITASRAPGIRGASRSAVTGG